MATGNFEFHPHKPISDPASELLIAQWVLNDIASIQTTQKGKAREDTPINDEDLALNLQPSSLNALIGILRDYRSASSIDRTIESDTRHIGRLALLEQAERDDHRAAVVLGEGYDSPQQMAAQRMVEQSLYQPLREPALGNHQRFNNATQSVAETVNLGMENLHLAIPVTPSTVSRNSLK